MLQERLKHFRTLLTKKKFDAAFISAVPSITYLTQFYGFDNEDRNAFLLITQTSQYIFTHGIYKEAVKRHIKEFTLIDITREKPMSSSLQNVIQTHSIKRLGFEAADLSFLEYQALAKKIGKKVLYPADTITQEIRIKKSPEEVAAIAKASTLGDKAFSFLLTQIKEGVTEKEVALAYEIFVKKQGATLSFDTVVAFGSNSAFPHHTPSDKKLTKQSFVMLDFGVKNAQYCSDMTRTVFFGKADEKQKNLYQTVLDAQQKALEYIRSAKTISAKKADAIARNYIIKQGYPTIPHSLGHGIGILIHERPRLSPHSKDILSKGMVFSVEPGIYISDYAGVRIEDLVALTENGIKMLTNAPKQLIELS